MLRVFVLCAVTNGYLQNILFAYFTERLASAINKIPANGTSSFQLYVDKTSPAPSQSTKDWLQELARKRKFVVLKVHTRKHSPHAANLGNHATHTHFILLRGVAWDSELQRQVTLVQDPGSEFDITKSFDRPRNGDKDEKGYDGDYSASNLFQVYEFTTQPPETRKASSLNRLEIGFLDSAYKYLLENPEGKKLGENLSTGAPVLEIDNGSYHEDGLASDEEGSNGEAISSSKNILIEGNPLYGTYKVRANLPKGKTAQAVVTAWNGTSQTVQKFLRLTGDSAGLAMGQFVFGNGSNVPGVLSLSQSSFETKSGSKLGYFELAGGLVIGAGSNGLNPLDEDVTVSLDGLEGETLPSGSFEALGNDWLYYRPEKTSGIYYFKISPLGDFLLKAKGLSDLSFNAPTFFGMNIEVGDDAFSGFASALSTKARPNLEILPDKILYMTGNKATIKVVPTKLPSKSSGQEYWVELNIDGTPSGVFHSGEKKWIYSQVFSSSGTRLLRATLYIQDRRAVKSIQDALASYAEERKLIGLKLAENISEEDRQVLQARLNEIASLEAGLRQQLLRERRQIGTPEEVEVYVQ